MCPARQRQRREQADAGSSWVPADCRRKVHLASSGRTLRPGVLWCFLTDPRTPPTTCVQCTLWRCPRSRIRTCRPKTAFRKKLKQSCLPLVDQKWPFETAEKRTGLESRLKCGEVGRPAAALHFVSGLHAAVRYLLCSGTRASVLKTSSSLEECLTSGRKGICGRSPGRTPVAPPSVSWHRRVTSDLFEPYIGR